MTHDLSDSVFSQVQAAPVDPILGLSEAYNLDNRATKYNLGVGAYKDASGDTCEMEVVKKARELLVEKEFKAGYLPIAGHQCFIQEVQKLLFGASSKALPDKRVVSVQSLGGTGALRLGADFLKEHLGCSSVFISNPTWANHRGIFSAAGYQVYEYPYYDQNTKSLVFDSMLETMQGLAPKTVVVLHVCCHNPSGADLSEEQWSELFTVFHANKLIPFFDFAYQGFARGLVQDAYPVRLFDDAGLEFLVAQSFSKSFSLYKRRIGHLSIVNNDASQTDSITSQLKIMARRNYSNPPSEGAEIIAEILSNQELRPQWESELEDMRTRIKSMRELFVQKLKEHGVATDYSFILEQNGMFSFSGLSKEQVLKLKEDFGIYTVDSGRVCIAAMNEDNIDYIAEAISKL